MVGQFEDGQGRVAECKAEPGGEGQGRGNGGEGQGRGKVRTEQGCTWCGKAG